MNEFQFAQPLWLATGIVIAVALVASYRYFDNKNRADLGRLVSRDLLAKLLGGVSKRNRLAKRVCFVSGILLLFGALARPQYGHEWKEVKRKGIDILFALDSSRSMLAEDVAPNRLERAKLGMLDFVDRLEGDRVGLLPFAGSAYMLCPLTLDYEAFRQSLDAVDTDIIPRKGTDLASAIREAERAFEKAGNNYRILVIITDGEDLQGEALDAAKSASEAGTVIHTVGIGSAAGELIPIRSRDGSTAFLTDESGQPVRSKLDEDALSAIAEATDGTYAPFGQNAGGLNTIYEEKLSLVPQEELSQRMQKVPIEQFQWPLALALLMFLVEIILGDRRRSAEQKTSASIGAPGRAAALAAVAALFISITDSAAASETDTRPTDTREIYNSGVTAYRNGELERAGSSFQDTIESTTDLALQSRAYYNLGNTLFKAGAAKWVEAGTEATIADWEKSLAAYEGSLALNPEDVDAQFNRDLVQRKLEELKNQQEQEQDHEKESQDNQNQEKSQEEKSDQNQSDKGDSGSEENDPEGNEIQQENPGENDEKDDPTENSPSDNAQKYEDEAEPEDGQQVPHTQPDEKESAPKSDASDKGEQPGENEEEKGKPEESSAPGENTEKKLPPESDNPSPSEPDQHRGGESLDQNASVSEGRREPGEMTKEEARQLLEALEKDEDSVLLVPARSGNPRDPDNTTKGKDW